MTPDANFGGAPRMRGHADLFREQMSAYGERADRQYESFKQAKNQIAAQLQAIDQRRQKLVVALQNRIQSIHDPETAKQFQIILDQLQQQYGESWQEMVRQANAGITRIQEAHTGFQLPSQEVFASALNAQRQAMQQLNVVIETFSARAGAKQQELRGTNEGLQQQTDTIYNSYEAQLTQMYGGKEAREAQEGVAAAENALQQATVAAVVGGLSDLKTQRGTLDTERGTKQGILDGMKGRLAAAKVTLQAETAKKTKAETWPAEIEAREQELQTAKDAVTPAETALNDARVEAAAGRVDAGHLLLPDALAAVNACNAKATADEGAVVAPLPVIEQKKAIEEKRVKDVALIQKFFKAKTTLDEVKAKVTAASRRVRASKKKVTDEAITLRVAPPGNPGVTPWKESYDAVIQERQKRIDEEQKKVQPLEDQVTAAEQEMVNTFTNPLKEMDAQIKGLEAPVTQATEAVRVEKAKVTGLGRVVVRARPNAAQKKAFLSQSRSLLTQINTEGRFMRNHFSGEQKVEDRTIDLVKKRTDVATEIAKRSREEKDVRTALDFTKEELRWLNRNADQHPERIAVLMGLERSLNGQYVRLLTVSTNKILLTGTPEQKVTAIERELQYLPGVDGVGMRAREKELSNPVVGHTRGLLQKARDLQYAPLRTKTRIALTDKQPDGLGNDVLEKARVVVLEEWRFLKRNSFVPVEGAKLDTGRLSFLANKYLDIKRVIANRRMNTLTKGVQESDPAKLLAGVQQIEADIAKNESPQKVQQLTTLLGEQLPKIAGVVDAHVNVALTSGKDQNIVKAMDVVRNELALHARRTSAETPRREGELRTAYAALLNALRSLTEAACVSASTGKVEVGTMDAAFRMLDQEEQQLKSAPQVAMLVSAKQPDGTWTQKRIPQIPLNCQERLRSIGARRDELANRLSMVIEALIRMKDTLDASEIARTIALIDLEKKVSSALPMVNETRAAERLVLRGQLEAIKPQVKKSERKSAKAAKESARLDKSRETIALEEFLTNEIDPVLQQCNAETADPAKIKEMRKPKNKDKRTARMTKFDSMHVSLQEKMATAPTDVLKTRVDKAMRTIVQLKIRYRLPKENKQWIEDEMNLRSSDVDTLINNIDSATSKHDLQEAITQAKKYGVAITEWASTVDAAAYDTDKVVEKFQKKLADAVQNGEQVLKRM